MGRSLFNKSVGKKKKKIKVTSKSPKRKFHIIHNKNKHASKEKIIMLNLELFPIKNKHTSKEKLIMLNIELFLIS